MQYHIFGKSGLRVSEICLGTMTFGQEFGWGSSKVDSRQVFDTFVEAGGNFFDTANYYTRGTSEEWLGEFVGSDRQRHVLATKYTLTKDPSDPNASGNHRKNMMQSLEASLKRMKTDYIDLYWMHAWDSTTPIEEVMRALDDMVRQGKILHIGLSDTPAWAVSRGNTVAELRGWTPVSGLQLEYSLIQRTIEGSYFEMCNAYDLPITAWSPLGMGVLTGKYLDKSPDESRFGINPAFGESYITEKNNQIAAEVIKVAKEINRSPAQIALAWLKQQRKGMIPIVGAKNAAQLKDSLGCLEFELSLDQLDRLDGVSRVDQGFPAEFLQREGIRSIMFGDALS